MSYQHPYESDTDYALRQVREERKRAEKSDKFMTSMVIGAVTDSAIIGGLLGGDIVGGIAGDFLNGGKLNDSD